MKIAIIFLTCIILTCFASASSENITLIYPSNVTSGQTFQVNLTLINFTEGLYDVKVDITNYSGDRISRVYNGLTWQSTFEYVNNATNTSFSNSSIFSMNITSNYNGTGNITISIRKSGHSSADDTFSGYTINITPQIIPTCTFASTCGSWSTCSGSSQTKTCTNTSTTCVNTTYTISQSCSSSSSIKTSLDWNEDEIINGKEFSITLNVENLEDDNYAVKVWIENDDEDIISERYGNYSDQGDVWVSGRYYIYNFFKDSGDDSADIKLRIMEEYSNFLGDAKIFFILKNGDEEETSEDIEILAREETSDESNSEPTTTAYVQSNNSNLQTSAVIILNSRANSTFKKENSIIYKSKTEYIREYAPYAFSIICIFIMILMLIDNKHDKR